MSIETRPFTWHGSLPTESESIAKALQTDAKTDDRTDGRTVAAKWFADSFFSTIAYQSYMNEREVFYWYKMQMNL